jgi:hypothetical protein
LGVAAGGSRFSSSNRRGANTGRGAKVRREGLAPLPNFEQYVPTIDSLEEICSWLGTFRERLRLARADERDAYTSMVNTLEARYQVRRAELS